jgi:hypothetical protein
MKLASLLLSTVITTSLSLSAATGFATEQKHSASMEASSDAITARYLLLKATYATASLDKRIAGLRWYFDLMNSTMRMADGSDSLEENKEDQERIDTAYDKIAASEAREFRVYQALSEFCAQHPGYSLPPRDSEEEVYSPTM